MDQRVSLRRFIVPALFAGLTLCGSLAFADETAAGGGKASAALTKATAAPQAQAASTPAPVHTAAAAQASQPARSSVVSPRSAAVRTTAVTRSSSMSGSTMRSMATHLPAHESIPRYGIDGTLSKH
jgi:hypothetical protein